MNVDIGVLGCPRGLVMSQEFYGKPYERYLESLYNSDITRGGKAMRIFKHPDGNVVYVYTVGSDGKTFVDSEGRSGSFFGIVMAFKDFEFQMAKIPHVYQILDSVYENVARGYIIADNNGAKRHLMNASSFGSAQTQKRVADAVISAINHEMVRGDIIPFKYDSNGRNSLRYVQPATAVAHPQAPAKSTASTTQPTQESVNPKDKFDSAIEKLKQMGINPDQLAQYILDKKQKD